MFSIFNCSYNFSICSRELLMRTSRSIGVERGCPARIVVLPLRVRCRYLKLIIKPGWTQQSFVNDLPPVGRGDHPDILQYFDTNYFRQH